MRPNVMAGLSSLPSSWNDTGSLSHDLRHEHVPGATRTFRGRVGRIPLEEIASQSKDASLDQSRCPALPSTYLGGSTGLFTAPEPTPQSHLIEPNRVSGTGYRVSGIGYRRRPSRLVSRRTRLTIAPS